ncbi:MAG: glycosyltransferase [Candidatus Peribacter riflensis]|uniref:Glycosyltransferase n=1 Tax=Candidatus Peribacter riflensis TaxID=1735162 RepID=A0A0S1SJ78_9BACT|nr:MAG: glycosyltransferase [Candidatus Peribacter riflensis]ALM11404.1 MAG: glycosyltransferase [Candidatus Peribacter riflensis]ALM12506.1 MAG: glycosyltransferase [Candidatus Peribacter riflensis]ALM13607.1 MAG: glycosyltransferase [Candidatus Peribacter riflensis]ALM14710.1 MAG: glycosyltransferase [Candidatus Peribacter riflensis]
MILSPESAGTLSKIPSPLQVLSHPLRSLLLSLKLRSALLKSTPDIIHITVEPYALLASLWPHALLHRTVITFHGSYGVRLLQNSMSRRLLRRVLASLPAFIAVSSYTKNRIAEECNRRCSSALADRFLRKTQVVYNAICLPSVPEEHVRSDRKQILLIGPLKPRKGVLEAVEACALYRQMHANPFTLRIIGTQDDSAYSRTVEQRIVALHMQDEVRFEGVLPQDKLDAAYRSADLLLLPARTTETTFEGFGLVFIEAASYGVPSIGPTTSGAAEAIEEGKSGYRVRPDDAAQIAQRMHSILDEHRIDPETCRAWAQRFSIASMAAAMSGLYATAVGSEIPGL